MANKEISLGHSPDSDDAFMFYGLTRGKFSTEPYSFKHILADIETLNEYATNSMLDVTAVSLHAYAYIRSNYALLSCGASMGYNCGPIIVAKEPMSLDDLKKAKIAIPGTMTTAFLALRMLIGGFDYQSIAFDKILLNVAEGSADAGLLIHEGQINYADLNLVKIIDLGEWWTEQTQLPLPLGVNVIRRDLGPAVMKDIARLIRQSIEYAFENPGDAFNFAHDYAKDLDRTELERFVRNYVNKWTLDCGPEGIKAINTLLYRAEQERLIPPTLPVDFI